MSFLGRFSSHFVAGCGWFSWRVLFDFRGRFGLVSVVWFGLGCIGFRGGSCWIKLPRNEIAILPLYLASPEALDAVFGLSSTRATDWWSLEAKRTNWGPDFDSGDLDQIGQTEWQFFKLGNEVCIFQKWGTYFSKTQHHFWKKGCAFFKNAKSFLKNVVAFLRIEFAFFKNVNSKNGVRVSKK